MGRNYIGERWSTKEYKAGVKAAAARRQRAKVASKPPRPRVDASPKLVENDAMANHPNRSKTAGDSPRPTPAQLIAARQAAGLTQTQAASLLHTTLRAYQQWEAEEGTPGHRGMHPAFWELFTIKTMGMQP